MAARSSIQRHRPLPPPVSVVVRGNYPLVEYPELAVLSPSVTVALAVVWASSGGPYGLSWIFWGSRLSYSE